MKTQNNAQTIKKFRKMAGLTQAELGLLIGIPKPTISGYEIGSRVHEDVLKVIVRACRKQIRKNARQAGVIP